MIVFQDTLANLFQTPQNKAHFIFRQYVHTSFYQEVKWKNALIYSCLKTATL